MVSILLLEYTEDGSLILKHGDLSMKGVSVEDQITKEKSDFALHYQLRITV